MKDRNVETPFETVILEQTITKIGALLALGFGEAGARIVAKNIQGGDVQPMVPGTKVIAIFAFCDIRHFSHTTEVLQVIYKYISNL
jgi:class 3 adenylate cyclase